MVENISLRLLMIGRYSRKNWMLPQFMWIKCAINIMLLRRMMAGCMQLPFRFLTCARKYAIENYNFYRINKRFFRSATIHEENWISNCKCCWKQFQTITWFSSFTWPPLLTPFSSSTALDHSLYTISWSLVLVSLWNSLLRQNLQCITFI